MQLRTRPVDALSSGDHDGINMRLPGRPQEGDRCDERSSVQPGSQLHRIRTVVASGKGLGGGRAF